jgi:hypothetical protein
MTALGWIFMLASITFVISLVSWCFYRVLQCPSAAERMHAPAEIDTHDLDT